jgi:hypothetical protein
MCLIPWRVTAVEKLPPALTHRRAILLLPLPCHRLPSLAMRTSSVPALYAPPRPHLHLPEHHRNLGYLSDLSSLTDEHPSDPSPEPYFPPSSPPPQTHIGEPPSIQNPKLGSPPRHLTLAPLPRQPCRRPPPKSTVTAAMPAGASFPYFGPGPKWPSGLRLLARPGQAPLWAMPTATIPIFIFLSNYSNSILIKVQTSKSVGNCMDLIKL